MALKPPSRPLCSWFELILIIALALVGGAGLGATYSHVVFGELPWFTVQRAVAVDGNTIAITALIHVQGLAVPQLDRDECPEEKVLAERARARAQQLLDQGSVRVRLVGENEYGQIDGLFVGADRPIGPILIRERLAKVANGGMVSWCPNAPPPPRLRPWYWPWP